MHSPFLSLTHLSPASFPFPLTPRAVFSQRRRHAINAIWPAERPGRHFKAADNGDKENYRSQTTYTRAGVASMQAVMKAPAREGRVRSSYSVGSLLQNRSRHHGGQRLRLPWVRDSNFAWSRFESAMESEHAAMFSTWWGIVVERSSISGDVRLPRPLLSQSSLFRPQVSTALNLKFLACCGAFMKLICHTNRHTAKQCKRGTANPDRNAGDTYAV